MKHFNLLKRSVLGLLAVGLLFSCQEWDDHYSVDNSIVPDMNIAQLLESNPDLSKFVDVLKNTYYFNGKKVVATSSYFDMLASDQFMTVWAPVNSSMTSAEWDALMVNPSDTVAQYEIAQRFVRNHIARFANPVSNTEIRIPMLSGKRYYSKKAGIGTATYKDGSINMPCNNGVVHFVEKPIEYAQSIYEYLTTSAEYADNIGAFFKKYTRYIIDEEKSVAGGIVDGQVVYVDSVLIETSILLNKFGFINDEDSLYYVVLPTASAWEAKLDEIDTLFHYLPTTAGADSVSTYWKNDVLLTDAFFNMNEKVQNLNKGANPKVFSTLYDKDEEKQFGQGYHLYANPTAADGIFNKDVVNTIECSNGKIMQTSTWSFDPAKIYANRVIIDAESAQDIEPGVIAASTVRYIRSNNPFSPVWGEGVLDIHGKNSTTDMWTFKFGAFDNLSAKYNIGAVILPNSAAGTMVAKPNKLSIKVYYYNELGEYKTFEPKSGRNTLTVENDITKRDTVWFVKGFQVFWCNYGQERSQLKLEVTNQAKNTDITKGYSNTCFLDCLILEPVIE